MVVKEYLDIKSIVRINMRNVLIEDGLNWNNYFSYHATQDNLKTSIGKGLVLDRLGGMTGSDYGAISYCAVGTSNTPASESDTQLGAEVARKPSAYSRAGNIGTFSGFFNTGEANTTIREIGFFGGNATSTQNSGKLFNRIVLSTPIEKTSDYTLTIDLDISCQ